MAVSDQDERTGRMGGEKNGVRVWRFPDGDAAGIYFFAIPPDLPKARSLAELRAFYTKLGAAGGTRTVDFELGEVAGLPAIRAIVKLPQTPHGMTYVASITLPFAGCSYVVKVQCEERGMTGAREAVLADRRLADGCMKIDPKRGPVFPPDWNPDAPEHDEQFPDHPVSRARRHLRSLANSIQVDERLRQEPPFPLPG